VNVVMREPAEEEQGFWLQGPANGEERGSEGAREAEKPTKAMVGAIQTQMQRAQVGCEGRWRERVWRKKIGFCACRDEGRCETIMRGSAIAGKRC
jgi:hypothetical protein